MYESCPSFFWLILKPKYGIINIVTTDVCVIRIIKKGAGMIVLAKGVLKNDERCFIWDSEERVRGCGQ